MISNDIRCQTSLEMVAQLLDERDFTPEMIAIEMNTSVKRVKALINEVDRRKSAEKSD